MVTSRAWALSTSCMACARVWQGRLFSSPQQATASLPIALSTRILPPLGSPEQHVSSSTSQKSPGAQAELSLQLVRHPIGPQA